MQNPDDPASAFLDRKFSYGPSAGLVLSASVFLGLIVYWFGGGLRVIGWRRAVVWSVAATVAWVGLSIDYLLIADPPYETTLPATPI